MDVVGEVRVAWLGRRGEVGVQRECGRSSIVSLFWLFCIDGFKTHLCGVTIDNGAGLFGTRAARVRAANLNL